MDNVHKESLLDETLVTLGQYCMEGWPRSKCLVKEIVKPYWSFLEEINVLNDIVYRNTSVIIPVKMRKEILKKIHDIWEWTYGSRKNKKPSKRNYLLATNDVRNQTHD